MCLGLFKPIFFAVLMEVLIRFITEIKLFITEINLYV